MNKLSHFAGSLIALAAILAQNVQADLITGGFQFTGNVTYDSDSVITATAVTAWNTSVFGSSTGDFASPSPYALTNGQPIAFAECNWNFRTTSPVTNFWSVGGFHFELLSSTNFAQGGIPDVYGYVDVSGVGIVSGNEFTPTTFIWQFSSPDPSIGGVWVFSAGVASSNSNGAPVLTSQKIGSDVVMAWADPTFTLQAAPAVESEYTNVPNATSPYTNNATGLPQFFRLNQ